MNSNVAGTDVDNKYQKKQRMSLIELIDQEKNKSDGNGQKAQCQAEDSKQNSFKLFQKEKYQDIFDSVKKIVIQSTKRPIENIGSTPRLEKNNLKRSVTSHRIEGRSGGSIIMQSQTNSSSANRPQTMAQVYKPQNQSKVQRRNVSESVFENQEAEEQYDLPQKRTISKFEKSISLLKHEQTKLLEQRKVSNSYLSQSKIFKRGILPPYERSLNVQKNLNIISESGSAIKLKNPRCFPRHQSTQCTPNSTKQSLRLKNQLQGISLQTNPYQQAVATPHEKKIVVYAEEPKINKSGGLNPSLCSSRQMSSISFRQNSRNDLLQHQQISELTTSTKAKIAFDQAKLFEAKIQTRVNYLSKETAKFMKKIENAKKKNHQMNDQKSERDEQKKQLLQYKKKTNLMRAQRSAVCKERAINQQTLKIQKAFIAHEKMKRERDTDRQMRQSMREDMSKDHIGDLVKNYQKADQIRNETRTAWQIRQMKKQIQKFKALENSQLRASWYQQQVQQTYCRIEALEKQEKSMIHQLKSTIQQHNAVVQENSEFVNTSLHNI